MNNNSVKTALIVEVSRLYYEHNFSQNRIAEKIGISRPGVSRLLKQAREQGIVKIEINDPAKRGTKLETLLQKKFGLKKVIIVPDDRMETQSIKQRLGLAAARYLDQLLEDGVILGVSWGTTMQEVVRHLCTPRHIKNMTVVQLNGGVSRAVYDTHASEIAQKIGEHYQAVPFLLPLPAIVDHPDLKRTILSDRNISHTLELAYRANVAMYTVGAFGYNSVLVKADYFESNEVEFLLKRRAAGDICSRIITETGKICWPELDDRTFGIELEELSKKEYAIAVAGGKEKLKAIYAGLCGKCFNVLITDEWIATEILHLSGGRK
jgi:deoxyribonucleoside regulator